MKNTLAPVKMITIIALDSLEKRIIEDLKSCGVKGYTVSNVEGEGLHARHFSPWEGRNIRIETLTNEERASNIMNLLSEHYFEKYGIVAFVSTVEVLRQERFTQ